MVDYNVSGIYQIKNITNGKCYIGSAVNIKKRWAGHKSGLRGNRHPNKHLQNAWNINGEDAFEFSILEECFIFSLLLREQHFINLLSPAYNILLVAGSSLGVKRSDETRNKMSAAQKGRPNLLAKGRPAWNKGKTLSAEHRANLLLAAKNRKKPPPVSLEHREKMSIGIKKYWADRKNKDKSDTCTN